MRTTVRLPDDLLRRAKSLAADAGVSLTTFIEHAVRDRVDASSSTVRDYPPLPVIEGTGWFPPGVNTDKGSELFMQEDMADGKFR